MKIGYVRVSSSDQNLDRQIDALKEAGAEKIYSEKQSGKNVTDRPILKKALEFLREGDTLIVSSFDRLARSTTDLLHIVDDLQKRNIGFLSMQENIDTKGASGKLILTIFGALAEFERSTIRERQKEGIESAKARGKHLGRPKAEFPENWKNIIQKWENKDIIATEAMKALKLKKATFYRLYKKDCQGRL